MSPVDPWADTKRIPQVLWIAGVYLRRLKAPSWLGGRRDDLEAGRVVMLKVEARRMGIPRKQLEIDFLGKHFLQHYNTVTGSLVTWPQIPDWLARDALSD